MIATVAAQCDRPVVQAPPVGDATLIDVLNRIKDPCSIAAGRPVGLYDLGLVLGWEWTGPAGSAHLTLRFCVTFPGCMQAPHFTEAARRDLSALPGVAGVTTLVDTSALWTPDRRKA
ncbi:MAG: hypothetical protein RLY86_996 [Pseudomonadota bacterium]|jgi:metal-sulfur cluster biosynthetic enzyme